MWKFLSILIEYDLTCWETSRLPWDSIYIQILRNLEVSEDNHLEEDNAHYVQFIHRHCIHAELWEKEVSGTKEILIKYILNHMENKNKTEDYFSDQKCDFFIV